MADSVDQDLINMVLPKVRQKPSINPTAGPQSGTQNAVHPAQVRPGMVFREDPANPGRLIAAPPSEINSSMQQEANQAAQAGFEQYVSTLTSTPGQNNPIPIESLSPAQQQEYWQKFRSAQTEFNNQLNQQPAQPPMRPVFSQTLTSQQLPTQQADYQPDLQAYRVNAPQPQPQPQPQSQVPAYNLLPQQPQQPQPQYQHTHVPQVPIPQQQFFAPPPTQKTAAPPIQSETGAVSVSPVCKLCGHDNRESMEVKETEEDWRNFLATFASGKPFERSYSVAEGRISVTLRDLTIPEADACYEAAYRALKDGVIANDIEFGDLLIRYQTSLQVKKIFGAGVNYEAPEGSHPALYPDARTYWAVTDSGTVPADKIVGVVHQIFTQTAVKSVVFEGILLRVKHHFSQLLGRIRYRASDPKKY